MKILHSVLVVFASVGFATARAQTQTKPTPAQLDSMSQPAQKRSAPAVHGPTLPAKGPIDYLALRRNAPAAQTPLPSAPLVGGANSCVTPDVIVGTGTFPFDNT